MPKSLCIYLAITGDTGGPEYRSSAVDETMAKGIREGQCKVRKGGLYEDRRTGELLYSLGFRLGEKWTVRETNCETVTLESNGRSVS